MKVLMLNGSRNAKGCTFTALSEIAKELTAAGIDSEIVHIGKDAVNGNIDAAVKDVAAKLKESDGLVIGSPVYYASPNGTLVSFLDRLFYSSRFEKRDKVGAAVVCARRGGCTAAFDVLNKYFTISGMPVATSTYRNQVHGANGDDARLDEEGMLCMRNLGANMAFLMESVALGKASLGLPEKEKMVRTNFIKR